MDVDLDNESARRKRTLPPSTLENQDDYTSKKKSINEHDNSRDSLTNSDKRTKILYSNSNRPPYIVHVYSTTTIH